MNSAELAPRLHNIMPESFRFSLADKAGMHMTRLVGWPL